MYTSDNEACANLRTWHPCVAARPAIPVTPEPGVVSQLSSTPANTPAVAVATTGASTHPTPSEAGTASSVAGMQAGELPSRDSTPISTPKQQTATTVDPWMARLRHNTLPHGTWVPGPDATRRMFNTTTPSAAPQNGSHGSGRCGQPGEPACVTTSFPTDQPGPNGHFLDTMTPILVTTIVVCTLVVVIMVGLSKANHRKEVSPMLLTEQGHQTGQSEENQTVIPETSLHEKPPPDADDIAARLAQRCVAFSASCRCNPLAPFYNPY